jgi:hypothetical protein
VLGVMFQESTDVQDVDDEFYERADAHINLANDQISSEVSRGKVSASFMYGMARFSTFICASNCESKEEFLSEKNDAIDYFINQYRKVLEENYDDYVDNYEKYMGRNQET